MGRIGSVGDGISAENANWSFGGSVADTFDDHVSKSVPLYSEGHDIVSGLSDFFVKPDSLVYELGCSTGSLIMSIAQHQASKPTARYVGIDVEPDMIARAEAKRSKLNLDNVSFTVDDVSQVDLQPCDFVVAYYTVQFIRPSRRQELIDRIYKSLQWGGALVLFEKVRGPDARFQDIMTAMYSYDYKLKQGYDAEEIVSKARSLKGIMEPFSTQGNIDMLKRAGFKDVMTIMKFICFEGFVAIK
jgi:tRNA (cmo5U34)-methyltransferase